MKGNHLRIILQYSASLILLALFTVGCSTPQKPSQQPTIIAAGSTSTSLPMTSTSTPAPHDATPTEIIPTTELMPTPKPVYDPNIPDSWKSLPVIPTTVSDRVHQIYEIGKKSGLNQHAFSKVGDCETYSPYFLAPFDLGPSGYDLGGYSSLEKLITFYEGSFSRQSLAAKQGFSVSSVLSSFWADPQRCKPNESPLICEIRVQKPAIMLVMFGTNDVKTSSREAFEKNLKLLLDWTIKNNVVPVLATKADNLELDGSINAIIARVAYEYELPVWNYWRALQELPDGGLEADQTHLTYAQPFFNNPENMQKGWPVRNLTALLVLEKLTNELEK
jgi:hypothetical protein